MNTKHTPGPWKHEVTGYGNISVDTQDGKFAICYFGNSANNAIYGKSHSQAFLEKEANARLIAEAGTVASETGLTPRPATRAAQ